MKVAIAVLGIALIYLAASGKAAQILAVFTGPKAPSVSVSK